MSNWEKVFEDDAKSPNQHLVSTVCRMPVPGGYIYRHTFMGIKHGSGDVEVYDASLCFVPTQKKEKNK